MKPRCIVKDGEKGSPENPLTLDELGPFLSKLTGKEVKIRGHIPATRSLEEITCQKMNL